VEALFHVFLPNLISPHVPPLYTNNQLTLRKESVERLPREKGTRPSAGQPVDEFVGDELQEIRAVFYLSMRAIEHALSAVREY